MFSNSPIGSMPHLASMPSGVLRIHHHSSSNPFDYDLEENDNNSGKSIYEDQFQQQQRLMEQNEAKLAELHMRKEMAKEDAEATLKLEKDINDLNEIMADIAKFVHDHVERTKHEVEAGRRHLRRAVDTQSAKYPAVAAAVGGVALGGPVGVVAGSAIAGIAAAVGGAFAGLYGGKFLRKHKLQQEQTVNAPVGNSSNID